MEHSDIEENMLLNIDKNINSDYFIDILRSNYVKYHNILYVSDLIGELYIHHIIHKDGFGFRFYMDQISELYVQYRERKISPERFELQKAKLISSVIATKIGIDTNKKISQEDMLRVKNYFLQEYVSNGYVSHAFPEAYYESIMKHGLISSIEQRPDRSLEIQEIQDIFMSKGVVSPMGGFPYYGGSGIYYEHDFTKTFQHAIDSPEWFCWFTSSDHTTTYHKDIETSPYILRSEKDCRRNIDDLCQNAGLNEDETKKVVNFYQKQYSKFSSPKLNVALISKKTIGKDDISKVVSPNMDLFNTISYVLNDGSRQFTEHHGNVYIGTISPDKLGISAIPNASTYIKAGQYSRETKEHLTSPENNLAILQMAEENKDRLVPSMVSKLEKTKQEIINKKKSFDQYIHGTVSVANVTNSNLTKTGIRFQQPKKNKDDAILSSLKEISFYKRSKSEIAIYNQIKQRNQIIKHQKAQKEQNGKPKVRTLTTSSSQRGSNGNKGFASSIILGIVAIILAGTLFITIYLIIGR